jgi:hypothetical protein
MLFDTDVLIWVLRGNAGAADAVDSAAERAVSIVTYMELLQGARDRREVRAVRSFLSEMGFRMVPLSENVGHRAAVYMEEYGLKAGLRLADALQAATAVENDLTLLTANRKHYAAIKDLQLKVFRP